MWFFFSFLSSSDSVTHAGAQWKHERNSYAVDDEYQQGAALWHICATVPAQKERLGDSASFCYTLFGNKVSLLHTASTMKG